jgi:hypothetical protein
MPEERVPIVEKVDEKIEIHLSALAEELIKKGVPAIRRFIQELRERDKEKFRQVMKELGIEVL